MANTSEARVALQLYSIHRRIQAIGLEKALEEVATIGYPAVEFAGYWGFPAADLKRLLAANGLVACGSHVGRDSFEGDALKAACDFARECGFDLLICPGGGNGLPPDWAHPKDDWWKFLAEFYAKAADEAAKFGCKIGLHNHAWEFQTLLSDGTTMWDYFFSNTPPTVCMEQDVGWTTYAGFDPCEQFRKYPGRSPTLHAKENGMDSPDFDAILGQPDKNCVGVDWDALFPVADANGVKWHVVECERHFDSLDAIAPSFEFLKAKGRA